MELTLPLVLLQHSRRLVEAWIPSLPGIQAVGPSLAEIRDDLALAVMERFYHEAASRLGDYQLAPGARVEHVLVERAIHDPERKQRWEVRGRIGVLATQRTVQSRTFVAELAKLGRDDVVQRAAPLLAPLVEEGWEDTDVARAACARYLADLRGCEAIILGCTHYPLLLDALREATDALLLDPGAAVAERLVTWLAQHPGYDALGGGRVEVHCTGDLAAFGAHAPRFFGRPLGDVRHVVEAESALAKLVLDAAPEGQVVR